MRKITLGISSCLLGNRVRYDGGHKLDPFLAGTVGRYVEWVPVCPEAASGLGIPREAMHLVGDPAAPRIRTLWTGEDHTARLRGWARGELTVLTEAGLSGFLFKARSPSCGVRDTRVFDERCRERGIGPGMFARAVAERFPLLPIEDEDRMRDPEVRESFFVRVFAYRRWQEFLEADGSLRGLVEFHGRHAYLIAARSRKRCRDLGSLAAAGTRKDRKQTLAAYGAGLMKSLASPATPEKNRCVLEQMAGCFRERLAKEERKELREAIESYRAGRAPLLVPVTLLNHYAGKYREHELAGQAYLNPHPLELMLRNHA